MTDQYQTAALQALTETQVEAEGLRLRVNSGSMRPGLHIGDWVVVDKITTQDLKLGDLVIIRREQDLVTHRLVRANSRGWWVKGDWLGSLDPFVKSGVIWGRVGQIERAGRVIDLRNQRRRWAGMLIARSSWWEAQILTWMAKRQGRLLRYAIRFPFRISYIGFSAFDNMRKFYVS